MLAELELAPEAVALLTKSQEHYARHARLNLTVDALGTDKLVWCSAHQTAEAVDGRVFTEAEIWERAVAAFEPLRSGGYTPVICVYTTRDKSPAKPLTKHRLYPGLSLHGVTSTMIRQSPPRMLFAGDAQDLRLFATEHIGGLHKFAVCKVKAEAWLKRAHYRPVR